MDLHSAHRQPACASQTHTRTRSPPRASGKCRALHVAPRLTVTHQRPFPASCGTSTHALNVVFMTYPKLYVDSSPAVAAIRRHFEGKLDAPVLIVGNGPSSVEPHLEDLPSEPVVMRMNWFFLEDLQRYGQRVDGYFWSVNTPCMQEEVVRVMEQRLYTFGAFMAPMRVLMDTESGSTIDGRLRPAFDPWALLATNPTLAREMMGRPLPTQGFQVLAFSLLLGFRDIYLSGLDLYQSKTRRYPYRIPDRLAARIPVKDLAPGYEDAHSLDRDLSFFETCRTQFPEVRVSLVSESEILGESIRRSGPRRANVAVPAVPPAFTPGIVTFPDGTRVPSTNLNQVAVSKYSRLRNGKKCAFATFAIARGFSVGARVLARSIAANSDVPLVVMCLPDTDKSALQGDNIMLVDIEDVENPNTLPANRVRFLHTYAKLRVFGLSAWDRLVFIDADAIVLKPIDELFDVDTFAACPDIGMDIRFDVFNSGVFCCQPSEALMDDILSHLAAVDSEDGGDQGFLNRYFRDRVRLLDRNYNVLKRVFVHHPCLFRWDDVKVLHYVGPKPWASIVKGDERYRELDQRWFDLATPNELVDLARTFAARPDSARPQTTSEGGSQSARSLMARKMRKLVKHPVSFVRDWRRKRLSRGA